ncbi:hypothetical protein, unlikely [Trypanosoma brucei gambiense DAL972]|uniref:Uncharacterized protein n=1 Tax=Trypanosoma brucei gambiense (strain MHOM/CI/86/DAL972) TaxID=679716 RepID=D0A007_TRYB9|nr:hypothetical protein, unlikely [Trypanosoma brucei gambiense DAL972]CBH16565.1 hypothetical protein, unlikely [Trypanosoma brucei gambiense DAL972]|eukprot:XP_011778829.1 hypothetical protein, unlikely [Trypanosoma brucei gambiense DAL972]
MCLDMPVVHIHAYMLTMLIIYIYIYTYIYIYACVRLYVLFSSLPFFLKKILTDFVFVLFIFIYPSSNRVLLSATLFFLFVFFLFVLFVFLFAMGRKEVTEDLHPPLLNLTYIRRVMFVLLLILLLLVLLLLLL